MPYSWITIHRAFWSWKTLDDVDNGVRWLVGHAEDPEIRRYTRCRADADEIAVARKLTVVRQWIPGSGLPAVFRAMRRVRSESGRWGMEQFPAEPTYELAVVKAVLVMDNIVDPEYSLAALEAQSESA